MSYTGPHGTPAASSRRITSARENGRMPSSSAVLSASRLATRPSLVASAGSAASSGSSSALQNRCHSESLPTATLMNPSPHG